MNLTLLALSFLTLLVLAYRFYGTWVAKQFDIDNTRVTSAHQLQDGVDYVPTSPFYLFGQHFSAIAAAGPIAGPIIACQAFGWLPCLIWIASWRRSDRRGARFFGSLAASVRHGGSRSPKSRAKNSATARGAR